MMEQTTVDPISSDGAKVSVITGIGYDGGVLYGYSQTLRFDWLGHYVAEGPPSRFVIDATEECP